MAEKIEPPCHKLSNTNHPCCAKCAALEDENASLKRQVDALHGIIQKCDTCLTSLGYIAGTTGWPPKGDGDDVEKS